ncbi:MAG: hypothetical protein ACRDZ1_06040, partial [Acidimicrobiia bacterium]
LEALAQRIQRKGVACGVDGAEGAGLVVRALDTEAATAEPGAGGRVPAMLVRAKPALAPESADQRVDRLRDITA